MRLIAFPIPIAPCPPHRFLPPPGLVHPSLPLPVPLLPASPSPSSPHDLPTNFPASPPCLVRPPTRARSLSNSLPPPVSLRIPFPPVHCCCLILTCHPLTRGFPRTPRQTICSSHLHIHIPYLPIRCRHLACHPHRCRHPHGSFMPQPHFPHLHPLTLPLQLVECTHMAPPLDPPLTFIYPPFKLPPTQPPDSPPTRQDTPQPPPSSPSPSPPSLCSLLHPCLLRRSGLPCLFSTFPAASTTQSHTTTNATTIPIPFAPHHSHGLSYSCYWQLEQRKSRCPHLSIACSVSAPYNSLYVGLHTSVHCARECSSPRFPSPKCDRSPCACHPRFLDPYSL